MKVLLAIQVMVETGEWSDSAPILHEIESEHTATVMEAISRQFNLPIRVTYPSYSGISECKTKADFEDYVGRLSGSYPRYDFQTRFQEEELDAEDDNPLYI